MRDIKCLDNTACRIIAFVDRLKPQKLTVSVNMMNELRLEVKTRACRANLRRFQN